MSSLAAGYYAHVVDLVNWLRTAENSVITKNRVRKQLWSEFMEITSYREIMARDASHFVRISRSLFVSLQTICLVDGRGDNLSDDQLLSFCTAIADLRERCPVMARAVDYEHKYTGAVDTSVRPVTEEAQAVMSSLIREHQAAEAAAAAQKQQ